MELIAKAWHRGLRLHPVAYAVLAPKPVSSPVSRTPAALCVTHDASFWPWHTWSDFATMTGKEEALVVVPLCGFYDHGLGHSLDAEEQVLSHVLKGALGVLSAPQKTLCLPPLRFVIGNPAECSFTLDTECAILFMEETLRSVAAAGFRRVVLLNASPWNEELVDAVARDVRISMGLQMFCINLSALELDFHPVRAKSRKSLQTLLTHLLGKEPSPSRAVVPYVLAASFKTVPSETSDDLATATAQGPALLEKAALHLCSLLQEIHARPALPHGGAIQLRTYP